MVGVATLVAKRLQAKDLGKSGNYQENPKTSWNYSFMLSLSRKLECFSCGALFHIRSRFCLQYFVYDCL